MNIESRLSVDDATNKVEKLERALGKLAQHDEDAGDGMWLEKMVEDVGTLIREWDIETIHRWAEWPEREQVLGDEVGPEDIGIDLVARRKGEQWIAIQCKSKGRAKDGKRRKLTKNDVTDFLSAIGSEIWAGRWIVSNGDPTRNSATLGYALQKAQVTFVEVGGAVRREHERRKPEDQDPRSAMQAEAVQQILKKLEDIRGERHEDWKPDEARAQAIMPCGTGKTRVGYQVACRLVRDGGLVIVMAPSIGLVRQLQGDWRALAKESKTTIATLAVCSDATAGGAMDARAEDEQAGSEGMIDPTTDRGLVRTRELTGEVAQSAEKVAEWIQKRTSRKGLQVIMSTYQSGHHTGEGLRIAEARADVMIADEAHRTAGIRAVKGMAREQRLRQFTACHDNSLIPAKSRLYMTATPRVFNIEEKQNANAADYIVAPMHREAIFGPVAYRLSYLQAVDKGFLSDYRIVAVALPGSAHDAANEMAEKQGERGRTGKDRSTSLALRKLAYGLALGGGVPVRPEDGGVMPLESSIAFLNRVQSSKDMAAELDEEIARKWIRDHLAAQSPPMTAKRFTLEHRDASHGAATREEALTKLKTATADAPAGVTNVGIFGEGIDTPSLSGVAFVEARRSPIDVIQAVGRAMRLSPNKKFGVILIPIEIPPGYDAEAWLESRPNLDGWKELGQILQALRAHDGRIEDRLADLMDLYVLDGDDGEEGTDLIAIKERSGTKVFLWTGPKGQIENILDPRHGDGRESATKRLAKHGKLTTVDETETVTQPTRATYGIDDRTKRNRRFAPMDVEDKWKVTDEGYPTAPPADKAKETLDAWSRIGGKKGRESPLRKPRRRKKSTNEEPRQMGFRLLRELGDDEGRGEQIRITLLEKSGLRRGPERDVNILRNTVEYAASRLRDDGLEDGLKAQLGIANLAPPTRRRHRADACTVMALLVLTAAIVHGRLAAGGALRGRRIAELEEAGTTPEALMSAWDEVLDVDYQPIFKEARNLIRHVTRRERKTAGLNEAVRRIVTDALEIGETYAHMEMDHAGQLFNEVMGDQAADGAYFTRPHAAVMLGGLAIEALDEEDWSAKETWNRAQVFDPTCGSGTLLTAYLTAAKAKARKDGAGPEKVQALHRYGVEQMLMGLDVNPVSLQLAGAQMTLGDPAVRYDRMNLAKLEYGYLRDEERASAGSLELLTDSRIVGTLSGGGQQSLELNYVASGKAQNLSIMDGEPFEHKELSEVVERLKGRRVALMNPPFVTRDKLGEKFEPDEQKAVRARIDGAQALLETTNPEMTGITDKTTARPLWVGLGLKAIDQEEGVLGMVVPTIGMLVPGGLRERKILAEHLHIRWVVTSHEIGNLNMSQTGSSGINECLVIGRRKGRNGEEPTKFISLDRQPGNRREAEEVVEAIARGRPIPWGHERLVCAQRMRAGDWSAAGWRSPELDEAAEQIRRWPELRAMREIEGVTMQAPGDGALVKPLGNEKGELWIINSRAETSQTRIEGVVDSHFVVKDGRKRRGRERQAYVHGRIQKWQRQRGQLLISAGQNTQTSRVAAVAVETPELGMRWKPVQGITFEVAKAWAVWLNSTAGRMLTACERGGTSLGYPTFVPEGLRNVLVPDPTNEKVIAALAREWERTRGEAVPSYKEGYAAIRRQWDKLVERAMAEPEEGEVQQWGETLAREPWVCGSNDR